MPDDDGNFRLERFSRQAALPIAGAIGGIVVPASVYFLTNGGGMESRGWAIPMATGIA